MSRTFDEAREEWLALKCVDVKQYVVERFNKLCDRERRNLHFRKNEALPPATSGQLRDACARQAQELLAELDVRMSAVRNELCALAQHEEVHTTNDGSAVLFSRHLDAWRIEDNGTSVYLRGKASLDEHVLVRAGIHAWCAHESRSSSVYVCVETLRDADVARFKFQLSRRDEVKWCLQHGLNPCVYYTRFTRGDIQAMGLDMLGREVQS